MERKKYIVIVLIFLVFGARGSNKDEIYAAYISGDMQAWKAVIDQMEEQKNSTDNLAELVNYQYGYIGWCIGMEQKREAKKYLELAEDNLEILEEEDYNSSEINAYKSAFYGFKVGLSPIKAPLLGPKSVDHATLAIEQDSANPLGYIQYGNAEFYMPAIFGGSKEKAVTYFEKALNLMEADSANTIHNWNYLSLLTTIAQSYQEMGETEMAEIYYKKALQAEPQFAYVKDELYPEFLTEIKK